MGSWLKSLWRRSAGAWWAAIAKRVPWWIPALVALVAIVFLVTFAVWIGGGELGAAVAAAVAASLSAVATFLMWRVMKAQTAIFREQTQNMRPGCRVHLSGPETPGPQRSLLGYFGRRLREGPTDFTGVVCIVVPKPGCRVVPVAASMEFLDRNEAVLESLAAEVLALSSEEPQLFTDQTSLEEVGAALHFAGTWFPSTVLEEQGEPVYVGLDSDLFAYYVQKLGPKRASRIRIAVKSNYGTDLSESIPLPALDDLRPLTLRVDLWVKQQAEGRQPSDASEAND